MDATGFPVSTGVGSFRLNQPELALQNARISGPEPGRLTRWLGPGWSRFATKAGGAHSEPLIASQIAVDPFDQRAGDIRFGTGPLLDRFSLLTEQLDLVGFRSDRQGMVEEDDVAVFCSEFLQCVLASVLGLEGKADDPAVLAL